MCFDRMQSDVDSIKRQTPETEEAEKVKKVGYIRVSTRDQNPDRQLIAMEEYGIARRNIYLDRMSGQGFSRPAYQKMLSRLQKGDVVVIKSIDRLGRNYGEILDQWRRITKEIQADIHVLDIPLLNTNRVQGNLTGVLISDLVLQILAYVAETERTFIKQRQAEGIAVAQAKGVKFGREKKSVPEGFEHYCEQWKRGEISVRKAAECLGMSPSTFYRRCRERDGQM